MKSRKIYYDIMRIIAILAVIVIHITAEVWYTNSVNNKWLIINFFNCLVHSWAVPLFLAISGALLLKKEISIKKIFTKYIPRILICLVAWHYIYYFLSVNSITWKHFFTASYNLLIGKTFSHLWYLYLLLGIYIFVPILSKLVKSLNKKELLYLIIIFFIVSIFIPNTKQLTGLDLKPFIDPYKIFVLSEYILFILLGYYLDNYPIKSKKAIYIFSTISIILLLLNSWYSNYMSIAKQTPINYLKTNTIISVLMTISIFSVSKLLFEKSKKGETIITKIGSLTFGTYLVHFLVIKKLTALHLTVNFINPIFGVFIILIIVGISSYIISFIISKIPIVKKTIGL